MTVGGYRPAAAVEDDGRGLPSDVEPGVGLRSIMERVGELGGTWSFGTSSIGGNAVNVALPVAR